jgi:hypothetical protein
MCHEKNRFYISNGGGYCSANCQRACQIMQANETIGKSDGLAYGAGKKPDDHWVIQDQRGWMNTAGWHGDVRAGSRNE